MGMSQIELSDYVSVFHFGEEGCQEAWSMITHAHITRPRGPSHFDQDIEFSLGNQLRSGFSHIYSVDLCTCLSKPVSCIRLTMDNAAFHARYGRLEVGYKLNLIFKPLPRFKCREIERAHPSGLFHPRFLGSLINLLSLAMTLSVGGVTGGCRQKFDRSDYKRFGLPNDHFRDFGPSVFDGKMESPQEDDLYVAPFIDETIVTHLIITSYASCFSHFF